MTSCAPLATTYGETLEYPWGLNDRFIVLAPGNVTLPFTVTVSILVAHASASTNFREFTFYACRRTAMGSARPAYYYRALESPTKGRLRCPTSPIVAQGALG